MGFNWVGRKYLSLHSFSPLSVVLTLPFHLRFSLFPSLLNDLWDEEEERLLLAFRRITILQSSLDKVATVHFIDKIDILLAIRCCHKVENDKRESTVRAYKERPRLTWREIVAKKPSQARQTLKVQIIQPFMNERSFFFQVLEKLISTNPGTPPDSM